MRGAWALLSNLRQTEASSLGYGSVIRLAGMMLPIHSTESMLTVWLAGWGSELEP